jgi:hypothetical protein
MLNLDSMLDCIIWILYQIYEHHINGKELSRSPKFEKKKQLIFGVHISIVFVSFTKKV